MKQAYPIFLRSFILLAVAACDPCCRNSAECNEGSSSSGGQSSTSSGGQTGTSASGESTSGSSSSNASSAQSTAAASSSGSSSGTSSSGNQTGSAYWIEQVSLQTTDIFRSVTQAQNGDIVAAGTTREFMSATAHGLVLRASPSGDRRWLKEYAGSSNDDIRAVAPLPSGGTLMAGYTASFQSNGGDAFWFLELDSNGDPAPSSVLSSAIDDGSSLNYRAYALAPTANGFIAAGSADGAGGFDLGIVTLNASGSPNVFQYDGNSALGDFARGVAYQQGVGALVVGRTVADGLTTSAPHWWLVRTGVDGSPTDRVGLEMEAGTGNDMGARGVSALSEGGWIVVGFAQQYGLIVKLTTSLDIVWARRITHDNTPCGTSRCTIINSIVQLPDGSYMAGGQIEIGGNQEGLLFKLSPSGGVQWAVTKSTTGDDAVLDIAVLTDGALAVVGITGAAAVGDDDEDYRTGDAFLAHVPLSGGNFGDGVQLESVTPQITKRSVLGGPVNVTPSKAPANPAPSDVP